MRWCVGPLPAPAIVCVQVAAGISAIGGRDAQGIVVADVAQTAGHRRVAVGQGEAGAAVIENARGPGRNGVASGAGRSRGRETGSDMIRHRSADRCGAGKSGLVAAVTVGGIERVIVVHMAGRAGGRRGGHVRSRQGKSGDAVIKRGCGPAGCRMASGAVGGGKGGAGSRVDGSGSLLPGGQVALRVAAIGRGDRQSVIVVDVAEGAGDVGVAIGEQESGGAVVERCRRPTRRVVAGRTICKREGRARGGVYGIVGLLPGGQMALRVSAIRGGDGQTIVIVDMTKSAGHIRMAVSQHEPGCAVVELGVQPIVKRMAGCAIRGGKSVSGSWMRRIGGLLPIL